MIFVFTINNLMAKLSLMKDKSNAECVLYGFITPAKDGRVIFNKFLYWNPEASSQKVPALP